jgi:hypothetical protein
MTVTSAVTAKTTAIGGIEKADPLACSTSGMGGAGLVLGNSTRTPHVPQNLSSGPRGALQLWQVIIIFSRTQKGQVNDKGHGRLNVIGGTEMMVPTSYH